MAELVPESDGPLLALLRDGVLTLTLNRPTRSNAVDPDTWRMLRDELRAAREEPEIRVVVLAARGKNFCAGADLGEDAAGEAAERSHLRFMREVGDVIATLYDLPVPTIAAVHGAAFGAGWNLALACDLVVAARTARFSQVFARRGLAVDSGGSWLMPKLVGAQRAKEIVMLAREVSAEEAYALGLACRLVEPENLDAEVAALATDLATRAPIALSLTKTLINESHTVDIRHALEAEARAQTVVLASRDGVEALAAFAERRVPRFTGR